MSFHVQGAPSQIQSNATGVGMVSGDQIGDQLPGLLATVQESAEATRTSALYYEEGVGAFNQPSFQREYGARNIGLNIQSFGDSAQFSVPNDMFWKNPMMIKCSFTIPYGYYGPATYIQHGVTPRIALGGNADMYYNQYYGLYQAAGKNGTDLPTDNSSHVVARANSVTIKPQMFYSWGAGYANIRNVRMNMGGAGQYTLDHNANWVGVMASCVNLSQRAALMKAAGGGVIVPDIDEEKKGICAFETTEIGGNENYSIAGGLLNPSQVQIDIYNGGYRNNPILGTGVTPSPANINSALIPMPIIENWVTVIKTPQTSFTSMFQYRRPVDTRLFSTDFFFDVFTSPSLDAFVDTGTGFQPQYFRVPINNQDIPGGLFEKYLLTGSFTERGLNIFNDGLFPSCLYRQFKVDNEDFILSNYTHYLDGSRTFCVTNADPCAFNGVDDVDSRLVMGCIQDYRNCIWVDWANIIESEGYKGNQLLNQNNLPTPAYSALFNAVRLANDQLGARQVLETRPDLAVYYPFQYFISQFINFNPLSDGYTFQYNRRITKQYEQYAGSTKSTNVNVPIQIPCNPLTCVYICCFREKDRMNLGYSTAQTYSPVLYWNALEMNNLSLTYSSQILQKYNCAAEYILPQLTERIEPLIVPFKGGCVRRSDLPLQNPELIQDDPRYPGSWYNAYIYELCMVDQLPLRNEAFFQQTPSFQGEMLNLSFDILPLLKPSMSTDFDFQYRVASQGCHGVNGTTFSNYQPGPNNTVGFTTLAQWCPGVPGACCIFNSNSSYVWNQNLDTNFSICLVFAQNALWQLNPVHTKMIFARGA